MSPESENVFIELLGLLPAEASEVPIIVIVNHKKIYEDSGISLYDDEGNRINIDDFVNTLVEKICKGQLSGDGALNHDSFYTGVNDHISSGPITKENVGFDALDSEVEIYFYYNILMYPGNNPFSEYLVAAKGDYDAQATRKALENQEEWPAWAKDLYTTELYNDVMIHSWGDGTEDHLKSAYDPPHLHNRGQARPLAVYDDYLFVASSDSEIKQMIDSCQNKRDSLADISDYALAAGAVYDMDVYNVILINPVHLDPESRNLGVFYSGYGLKETILVASGQGEDEKGKYVAVAYVQKERASAVENESNLEAYLDFTINRVNMENYELFEWKLSDHIIDKEISITGRVLTAKIYLDDEGFWWWWSPALVKM